MTDHFLTVIPGHTGFLSRRTADGLTSFLSVAQLGPDAMQRRDVELDYWDAANEDVHGRLPHQTGYGTPLSGLPVLAPETIPVMHRSEAA